MFSICPSIPWEVYSLFLLCCFSRNSHWIKSLTNSQWTIRLPCAFIMLRFIFRHDRLLSLSLSLTLYCYFYHLFCDLWSTIFFEFLRSVFKWQLRFFFLIFWCYHLFFFKGWNLPIFCGVYMVVRSILVVVGVSFLLMGRELMVKQETTIMVVVACFRFNKY